MSSEKIAIVGSGLIGRQWAIIFSSAGYQVQLYDVSPEALQASLGLLRKEIAELHVQKIARGILSSEQQISLISGASSLKECVEGAIHVQECVFEDLKLKQDVFAQIDAHMGPDCVLASSTSVQLPSLLIAKVEKHASQCIVAHPINPPLHMLLVELVPHPGTDQTLLLRTRKLMEKVGQKPVILNKEIKGFAQNRLQYAVIQEAFRLVKDGIMNVEDVDTVVTEGLGPRYAVIGPWLTCHLNANGLDDYFKRYSEGIYNVSMECTPLNKLEGPAASQVVKEITELIPLDKLAEKRAWRDKLLSEIARIKRSP